MEPEVTQKMVVSPDWGPPFREFCSSLRRLMPRNSVGVNPCYDHADGDGNHVQRRITRGNDLPHYYHYQNREEYSCYDSINVAPSAFLHAQARSEIDTCGLIFWESQELRKGILNTAHREAQK